VATASNTGPKPILVAGTYPELALITYPELSKQHQDFGNVSTLEHAQGTEAIQSTAE
jgi:hypothetical protein